MPRVEVRLRGRRYQVACEEGQQERLLALSSVLDRRARELAAVVGEVDDARLLLLLSLILLDEVDEARRDVDDRLNRLEDCIDRLEAVARRHADA